MSDPCREAAEEVVRDMIPHGEHNRHLAETIVSACIHRHIAPLLARCEAAEAERDALKTEIIGWIERSAASGRGIIDLEAERDRLREALKRIAERDSDRHPHEKHFCSEVARKALEPRP